MHPDPSIRERMARHAGRIETLIADITLEEKCRLCHGMSNFVSGDGPRLGIAGLVMSDGPHGVREEQDGRGSTADNRVTYLPTGSALAATWSVEMAALQGSVLGAEARARGKDVILGPGFNLTRTPLCGRNFEYLGEDPVLAGALACAAIQAIQQHDVAVPTASPGMFCHPCRPNSGFTVSTGCSWRYAATWPSAEPPRRSSSRFPPWPPREGPPRASACLLSHACGRRIQDGAKAWLDWYLGDLAPGG